MTQRYLIAQNQRRVLGIQDKNAVYRGEYPGEQGLTPVTTSPDQPSPAQQLVGTLAATEVNELKPWLAAVSLDSSGNVDLGTGYLACDVVKVHDSDDSHELSVVWNEDDSANRTLNILVSGANRSLTLDEDITASAYVKEADFDAGTFLYATSDNTPETKTRTEAIRLLAPYIVCNNDAVVCHNNEVVTL